MDKTPLSPSQKKALLLVPALMERLGDMSHGIQEPSLQEALRLIDGKLMQHATPADRLTGAMLKTYLHLDFPAQLLQDKVVFEAGLKHFIESGYTSAIGTHPPAYEAREVFENRALKFGTAIDGWALSSAISHQLAARPEYQGMEAALAGWLSFMLYQMEKHVYAGNQKDPFALLGHELGSNNLFKDVAIYDFAGPDERFSKLFSRLMPGYENRPAARATQARVTLADPQYMARKAFCIVAKEVFAHRAWVKDRAYENQADLLCLMANTLPQGGRIYISNEFDGIDYSQDHTLLALAGLKPVGTKISGASSHHYALERDHAVRPDRPVTADEFEQWRINREASYAATVRSPGAPGHVI